MYPCLTYFLPTLHCFPQGWLELSVWFLPKNCTCPVTSDWVLSQGLCLWTSGPPLAEDVTTEDRAGLWRWGQGEDSSDFPTSHLKNQGQLLCSCPCLLVVENATQLCLEHLRNYLQMSIQFFPLSLFWATHPVAHQYARPFIWHPSIVKWALFFQSIFPVRQRSDSYLVGINSDRCVSCLQAHGRLFPTSTRSK